MKTLGGLGLVLGTLLILACPTPNPSNSGQETPGGSTGALFISISEQVSSRTLLPALSMNPASYTISGHHAPSDTFTQTVLSSSNSITIGNLTYGPWTVTVDAYNGDSPPTLIGSGTVEVTVRTNATVPADVTVYPLAGTGGLALTVAWTGVVEAGSVMGTLTADAGGSNPISFTLNTNGSTYSNPTLNAGYYTLALQVLDTGTVLTGAAEKVRVVSGQTTSGVIAFEDLVGPGGSIATNVVVNLKNPLIVTLVRDSATASTADRLNFEATSLGGDNPVFAWYLNGAPVASALTSGATVSLPHDFAPGTYRLDVLVSTPGGKQAGSASYVFVWKGSFATAPTGSAHAAYFDTVGQIPRVWDGTVWQPFYSSLVVTVGAVGKDFPTIQAAVNAPFPPGYTIQVAAGTYDGPVDINKRVTVLGSGSDPGGTLLINSAAQGDFNNLPGIAGVTYGTYRPTMVISASGTADDPLVIKDLRIGPRMNIGYPRPGILLRPGAGSDRAASYAYITLVNLQIVGHTVDDTSGTAGPPVVAPSSANEWGFAVDGRTSVDHLIVSHCQFTDMIYGMIFFNATPSPSTATNIQVSQSVFARNSVKGFYAEKLSAAVVSSCAFTDNGSLIHAPYYFAATNAGLDLNLKYGAFSNLTFLDLTVTGNGLGSYAGAGLTIKARGTGFDTSYQATPASLSGVVIEGGTYTGNEVGVRLGEMLSSPPFASLGLTAPTGVSLQGPTIAENTRAQLLNLVTGLTLASQETSYGSP